MNVRVPGEKSKDNRICLSTGSPDPQPSRTDSPIEEHQGSALESQTYIDMSDICLENNVLKTSLIYSFFKIPELQDI